MVIYMRIIQGEGQIMVNVIICDDNDKDRKNVVTAVTKLMKSMNIKCTIYEFNDYDKKFDSIMNSKIPFKIYILDIETPSRSGIDVARQIRNKDVDSVIMFLTVHEDLGSVILKNDLMFLSFINKFDNFELRLKESLKKSIDLLHFHNVIRISDRNITYTFNLNDIIYITKESFERKTLIKTNYGEFKVSKSLNDVVKLLDSRFIQTHRACYINSDRKIMVDKTNRIITFDDGSTTNLLSDKYKKGVC